MTQKPDLPDYPRSRVVLIGCSSYVDESYSQLPAARNSLQRFHELLTTAGLCGWPHDRIAMIENPSGVVGLTKNLFRICRETEDVLLLYYVGHGTITPAGELCLTLSDTEAAFPDITGLEYRRVKQALLESPARVKVSIIDCCYSGRAIEALSGITATAADSTDTRGVYTMTASDHTAHVVPFAMQADMCTSFTGELIDLVRNGVPGAPELLTLGTLYAELRRRLAARSLPQPNHRGTDTADRFTFARNAQALRRFSREPWGPATVRSFVAHPSRISLFAQHRRSVHDIDALPVAEDIRIESLSYGEGPQTTTVEHGRLRTLPAAFRLGNGGRHSVGERLVRHRDVFSLPEIHALTSEGDIPADSRDTLAFPHEVLVSGVRDDPRRGIALHLITDTAYLQGIDQSPDSRFTVVCLLDRGGIAPFADEQPSGEFVVRKRYGTIGLLVAVEFDGGIALSRSRYTCVVRMGIRYPDDIWVSQRTGGPLVAGPREQSRFAFQSRQPNGLGWDVFVADFDGERMIDLTFKDHDGYSGFSFGNGEEAAEWLDSHRFQYVTMHRGRMRLAQATDWVDNE